MTRTSRVASSGIGGTVGVALGVVVGSGGVGDGPEVTVDVGADVEVGASAAPPQATSNSHRSTIEVTNPIGIFMLSMASLVVRSYRRYVGGRGVTVTDSVPQGKPFRRLFGGDLTTNHHVIR